MAQTNGAQWLDPPPARHWPQAAGVDHHRHLVAVRAGDVVATLDRGCAEVGFPKTIRVDLGREFISHDLDPWAYQQGVTLDFFRMGRSMDNDFIEALNGKLRQE